MQLDIIGVRYARELFLDLHGWHVGHALSDDEFIAELKLPHVAHGIITERRHSSQYQRLLQSNSMTYRFQPGQSGPRLRPRVWWPTRV